MSCSNKNISFNVPKSHNNDLQLPILFIAHTTVVLSDNTFIWVCLKWLHKLLSPNKTAFSSKTLMCKSDSSSAKCPPVVSLSKISPQRDLDRSVFNKKLPFGICTGVNQSSILFIHHKMSIFRACETFIFLSYFPLANLIARILSLFNDL